MGWDDLTEVQHRHFDRYILRSDKPDFLTIPTPQQHSGRP